MSSKKLWGQMEHYASKKRTQERDMAFMLLVKEAYDKDLELIISCFYDPMMPGYAQQGYMAVDGKRMLVCYSSEQRAKQAKYNATWNVAKAREVLNNMFNKDSIMGVVFNPDNENMVIILKEALQLIMPGEKPKPQFYAE